jgi:phage terminase small subunit
VGEKLTPKQELFVQGLFKGLSQRKAYKEAYNIENMTDTSIDVKSCELAKNGKIMLRLKELQQETTNNNKWTIEKLIEEFQDLKEICKAEKPLNSGEYKFEGQTVVKSLENIGKLLGYYTEKHKITGNMGVKIIDDIKDDDDEID